MKTRIVSVDLLKVVAVLTVMNSHMEICYGKYDMLATGGAIGDALFFFCSGFTILLGGVKSFPNYYKRRISRIYPTVVVAALLAAVFFDAGASLIDNVILGGGWFVQCIMLYYIPLWFVHRYFMNDFKWLWIITAFVIVLLYYTLFADEWNGSIFMYGNTKYKWVFNFVFMLYGGYVGSHHGRFKYHWSSIPMVIVCVIVWYSFFFLSKHVDVVVNLQYLSLLSLFGIVHYLYLMCNHPFLERMAKSPVSGQVIYIIGGLCLESYLIQTYFFTDKLNWLFPLNIPLIMLLVLLVAYGVNAFANLLSQTFKAEDYVASKIFLHKCYQD